MKRLISPRIFPLVTHLAGIAGLVLSWWLYTNGEDSSGLLTQNHPAGILLIVLSLLMLVVLFFGLLSLAPQTNYGKFFPPSVLSFAGCLFGALGVAVASVQAIAAEVTLLTVFLAVCGLLATVSLVIIGICRWQGQRPNYLFHWVVTAFFLLYTIFCCRGWGNETQLLVYCFPFLSLMFLVLTAYYHTALNVLAGSSRRLVFCNQAALFLCYLSIPRGNLLFYIPILLWLATDFPVYYKSTPRYLKEN